MEKSIADIVAREWPAIHELLSPPKPFSPFEPPSTFWESRISPPFPAAWPPDQNRPELDYYLSAAGRNLAKLMDGEYYTAPWGRIRANVATGRYEYTALSAPQNTGAQGVRPLLESEAEIFRDCAVQDDFAQAIATGFISPELAQRVRAYYLLWSKRHAVARLIKPLHNDFYSWMQSPVTKSGTL